MSTKAEWAELFESRFMGVNLAPKNFWTLKQLILILAL